jgi:hypothetical protein
MHYTLIGGIPTKVEKNDILYSLRLLYCGCKRSIKNSMKESWENRKKNLLNSLKEQYKDKPQSRWDGIGTFYIPTNSAALQSKILKIDKPVLFIKNSVQYYYLIAAFFLCCIILIVYTFFSRTSKIHVSEVLIILLCIAAVIFNVLKIFSTNNRIIISPEGIWIDAGDQLILWKNIIASLIEKVTNDNEELYLILHYYEPSSDEFKKIVYWLNNVGIEYQDLSFYIEYWKFKTEKKI